MVSALATHAKGLGSNLGTGVDFSLCESCLVILVSDPRHYKRSGEGLARVSCTHALSVVFTQTTSLCTHAFPSCMDFKDPDLTEEENL